MRWKTKPEPKIGDTRWVKKFAWFPVEMDSGVKLWLESYYVKQGLGWHYNWRYECVSGWYAKNIVTSEEHDRLCAEEDFLTAVSTSGNFTLEKTRKEWKSEALPAFASLVRYKNRKGDE